MHADTETDLPEENCATFKEAFFAVCPDERMTFEMFAREGPAPRPEDEEGRLWEESPQPAGRRAPPRRGAATNRTVRGNVAEGYTPV